MGDELDNAVDAFAGGVGHAGAHGGGDLVVPAADDLGEGDDLGDVGERRASGDRESVGGRRDHAILLLLARFGVRVSEVDAMELDDIHWGAGELAIRGRGWRGRTRSNAGWPSARLPPRKPCPSLQAKTVSLHVLSAAMALLHAGGDITVIALWLGHESPASTRVYLPTRHSRRSV